MSFTPYYDIYDKILEIVDNSQNTAAEKSYELYSLMFQRHSFSLSVELCRKIASYLPYRDVLALRLVCKCFRGVSALDTLHQNLPKPQNFLPIRCTFMLKKGKNIGQQCSADIAHSDLLCYNHALKKFILDQGLSLSLHIKDPDVLDKIKTFGEYELIMGVYLWKYKKGWLSPELTKRCIKTEFEFKKRCKTLCRTFGVRNFFL